MLSDFGTSQDMLNQRTRSGNTGTLEYTSPESLPCPSTGVCKEVDSKADIWSLGMILHKLLFLRLPYTFASDNVEHDSKRDGKEIADRLEQEVRAFTGFRTTPSVRSTFESRRMPQSFLILLERLLHIVPSSRPSAERVLFAIREGQLDPLSSTSGLREVQTSLIPRSPPPPMEDTEHERSSVSDYEDANEAGPAAFIKEEALPQQSDSTNTPAASRSGALWLGERQNNLRVPRVILTRTLKSVVLIAKVLSLYQVCGNNGSLLLKTLVLGLAIIDTWFDSLQVTLLLGAVHMVILPFLC
ncbi:hypothetical protein QCA50_013469 [Cerrena zonata]|uniref:mitogen-activated protein kinase kinase n=1 Tax=Cerrena zonata TaxID=2478898 RepID=A0AAW0FS65_9APHY